MRAGKKKLCMILAFLLVLSVFFTAGCKKEQELTWAQHGASHNIPFLELPGGKVATRDDYRYILRKPNKAGVPEDWGILEKKIKEADRSIENFHMGGETFLTRYVDTTLQTYRDYVALLKENGFKVLAESNLQETVYTTSLTYQECAYVVSYFKKTATIDVSVSRETILSPHLQKENYSTKADPVDGISTTLTMRPLHGNSTGAVIQLPNGHFVISGGGTIWDLPGMLEYLTANTPEGQTPVVEAWFLLSGSYDLCNWIMGLNKVSEDQLRINGVYYNAPGSDIIDNTIFVEHELDGVVYHERSTNKNPGQILSCAGFAKTQDGEKTPVYRPMSGQIYYFNGGLTVEIPLTQEQIDQEEYGIEFKVSSSSMVVRAEGKTYFDMAYLCQVNQEKLVEIYGKEYFADLDVLTPSYRGRYMYEEYQDIFCADVMLYPTSKLDKLEPEPAAVRDHNAAKDGVEIYSYANGTVRYDFATGKTTVIPKEEHQPLN